MPDNSIGSQVALALSLFRMDPVSCEVDPWWNLHYCHPKLWIEN